MTYGSSQTRGWIGAAAEAYATATATWDLSLIYNLHCSLWQYGIPNPLSEARDGTHILKDTMSLICWATTGTHLSDIIVFEHMPSIFHLLIPNM